MKKKINNLCFSLLSSFASIALLIAANSVNSTCLFLTYQPEIPEELK